MKKTSIYLAAGAIALTSALTACDNDFATPPAILPPAYEIEGNTPLLDIKTDNWQYLGGHYEMPYGETGDTIIFTGRVCSSDASGNMTRSLIVQSKDKDGNQIAINFSIQDYTLSNIFPYGQEVAVYASGMTIGGYHNLLQFGTWDATKGEMTFMSLDDAKKHIVRNHVGLPEPSKVDTTATTLTEIIAAKADQTQLMLWQSRLVRVEGVSFEDAGLPFAEGGYTERYITDGNGNRLNVRNNNRASFANDIIPGGTGSVTGILSYYNSDWQLMLLDVDGLKGFTPVEPIAPAEPTGEGTLESPYNVAKALEIIQSGSMTEDNVYVKGIIRSIKEIDTSNYGNATYDITDNGSNTFTIYRGKWLDNEKFTKPDQLAVGADVGQQPRRGGVCIGQTPQIQLHARNGARQLHHQLRRHHRRRWHTYASGTVGRYGSVRKSDIHHLGRQLCARCRQPVRCRNRRTLQRQAQHFRTPVAQRLHSCRRQI